MTSQAPLAYFLTFHTYGSWLHGRDGGSVVADDNAYGSPLHPPSDPFAKSSRDAMTEPPYRLDRPEIRHAVVKAIRGVCDYRGWTLLALHVRTTHVHVVVAGEAAPEKMLTDFKAYATRALNATEQAARRHRWSHHGSTRYIWDEASVAGAVHYTLYEQGEPLETHPPVGDPTEPSGGSSEPGA